MAMGGDGPWAITVMWALTAATFIFVLLRTYTRVVVVKSFGIDDGVYILAFVFLVCYTAFTTISARYGFGQNMYDLDPDDSVRAVLFEAIGQTFAVIGMAIAKWSLGIFLLRIVLDESHKWAIWIAMAALMAASISVCFVFWLQCTPPAYLWDRRIAGYCHVDSTPVSMTLCSEFESYMRPRRLLLRLVPLAVHMETEHGRKGEDCHPRQHEPGSHVRTDISANKPPICTMLTIPGTVQELAGSNGHSRCQSYPARTIPVEDTVGLIVWSAAEIAVTMICIGIPVCRPLYKRFLTQLTSSDRSKYKKGRNEEQDAFAMHTFGGSTLKPRDSSALEPSAAAATGKGLGGGEEEDLKK
ncbi:hypothetical protein PG997_005714, partial [Apiospora hydei]